MDKLSQWVALTVAGCLAVVAGGWFLLVSPKRAEAEALRVEATAQESGNASLRTQLAMLKAQAKDLPKKQAELAAVAAKIPARPELPGLIRALDHASTDAGVELVSIAPGAAVPVAAPGAAAAPADPAAAPAASGGLARIPLSVQVVGGYFQVQQFLSELESIDRALRVTTIALAPGSSPVAPAKTSTSVEDGRVLTAAITAEVYTAAAAATAPAAAAATTTAPTTPAPAATAPVPGTSATPQ